jgi:hypothetical protein
LKHATGDGRPLQRSSRVALATPIGLIAADAHGALFRARAETVNVNLHGAGIRTSAVLQPNARIQIFLPARKELRVARVVWAHPAAAGEYGIELQRAENCWPLASPPQDWTAPVVGEPGAAAPLSVIVTGYTLARSTFRETTTLARRHGEPAQAILWLQPLLAEGATLRITLPNGAVISARVVSMEIPRDRRAKSLVRVGLLNGLQHLDAN